MTLAAVAAKKEITLGKLESRVQFRSPERSSGPIEFFVAIHISGDLTERERKILFHSARSCEIGKMFNEKVDIQYQVEYGAANTDNNLGDYREAV